MRARTALAVLTVAAFAVGVSACAGGGDKAGGKEEGETLVLTLESEDDLSISGAPEFAAAVERLSEGAMRIEFVAAGRGSEVDFERGVVDDVRRGKAQLGIVGVRVWDTIGVSSFRALLAPFLVDSFALERRVLESPLGARMLEGVKRAGVVGIALHAGPLRRPFSPSRALVGPEDYRGARIGIRPSAVARATFRALGADAEGYTPGSVAGYDGTEIDPKIIVYDGWDRQSGFVTSNVVLWPKPFSIVMNREAFEGLDAAQKRILLSAGRDSLSPELRQTQRDAEAAMSETCRHGQVTFVAATASELAALREAVQPVYDELGRDPLTRELIAEIVDFRRGLPPAAALPRCHKIAPSTSSGSRPFEGRWHLSWTREELIAVGVPPSIMKDAPQAASVTIELRGGRIRVILPGGTVVGRGRYSVEQDVMNLVYDAPAPRGYVAGQVYKHRWSIFRDKLTFSRVPGSDADLVLLVNPLTRIR